LRGRCARKAPTFAARLPTGFALMVICLKPPAFKAKAARQSVE
jgi:hypothetical protein